MAFQAFLLTPKEAIEFFLLIAKSPTSEESTFVAKYVVLSGVWGTTSVRK